MKKLIVSNPNLQSKLDKIAGWKEVLLLVIVISATALLVWWAVVEEVL